jgi:hypothetical protein
MKNRAYKPKKRTKFEQFCEEQNGISVSNGWIGFAEMKMI